MQNPLSEAQVVVLLSPKFNIQSEHCLQVSMIHIIHKSFTLGVGCHLKNGSIMDIGYFKAQNADVKNNVQRQITVRTICERLTFKVKASKIIGQSRLDDIIFTENPCIDG